MNNTLIDRRKKRHKTAPDSDKPNAGKSFFSWDGDTLVLNILGHPAAKRDRIGKPRGRQLNVFVTAAPRAGHATDHMVKFLATEFGVKASAIKVVSGRKNVNKQLRIHAPSHLPAGIPEYPH